MEDLRATFFERLTDPRAVPILARQAIPVIGVFVFDWSVLETVAALFLDAVSTLWLVAAMGSYFAVKELDQSGETGLVAHLNFWASVFGAWLVIAALLTFAIGVPAAMLFPLVQTTHVDPTTLLTSGWLPRAFALMVACQLPSFVARVRGLAASGVAPEKMGMDGEVGFVLHRTAMLTMTSSMLTLFGPYALHALVLVAQTIGAVTEIMRDKYVAMFVASRRPEGTASGTPRAAPIPKYRRKRKHR